MASYQVSVPDALTVTMQTWMQTQLSADGQFFKYADIQDLLQQNLNTGLLPFFVNLLEQPQVQALQDQITALENSIVLTPAKPPVPVAK